MAVTNSGQSWRSRCHHCGTPTATSTNDYQLLPFIVWSAVLPSVFGAVAKAGWVAILGTVLGNLSFVGAPLATKVMLNTTDDISGLVKLLIDAGGNIGAAVCIAESASLPTP